MVGQRQTASAGTSLHRTQKKRRQMQKRRNGRWASVRQTRWTRTAGQASGQDSARNGSRPDGARTAEDGHDDDVADSVKLAAIRDALDRAGLAARTAVSVEVGPPKPWEQIMCGLTAIESGSRAEFRRSRGIPDDSDADHTRSLADRQRELPAAEGEPIDAEIVGYQPHRRIHRHPAGGE